MRKKLVILGFVLAAAVAGARSPVAAGSCPPKSFLFVCPTYSFCCPFNARCVCLPR